MSLTPETLYLHLYHEIKAREILQTRVDVLEHFIKQRYPEYFAGEAETVADPELNAIPIVYGEPEESFDDDKKE